MTRFKNKAIVVTGGSNGIGLATAKRIVAEGGKVLVTGTNKERLEAAAASAEQRCRRDLQPIAVSNSLARA